MRGAIVRFDDDDDDDDPFINPKAEWVGPGEGAGFTKLASQPVTSCIVDALRVTTFPDLR